MLINNPSMLMNRLDSPKKRMMVLDNVMPERKQDSSILLDKDERELVKKGDEVTKEEMWNLLETKRFKKLK